MLKPGQETKNELGHPLVQKKKSKTRRKKDIENTQHP